MRTAPRPTPQSAGRSRVRRRPSPRPRLRLESRRSLVGIVVGAFSAAAVVGLALVPAAAARPAAPDVTPSVIAGVTAASANLPVTSCGQYSNVVACYEMNDTGTTMQDSSSPATNVANATGNAATGVRSVARDGAPAEYYFPGWSGLTSTSPATLGELKKASIPKAYGAVVVDGSKTSTGDDFSPGTGPWRMAVRLRPLTVDVRGGSAPELPNPSSCRGCPEAHPSYNVMQKGRNGRTVAGGFYKIEIMGYSGTQNGNRFVKGSVHCHFRDSDGTSVEAMTGASGGGNVLIDDSTSYYDISCYRSGSSLTLSVTELAASGATTNQTVGGGVTERGANGSLDNVSPQNQGGTRFSPILSIGKKPDTTGPEDSFAGWVDYAVFARS